MGAAQAPDPRTSVGIYRPQPGPQTAMLECPAQDIFVGGARMGGKSYGALGAFAIYAAKYGEHAVGGVFRKSFTELKDIWAKSRRIFGPMGWKANEGKHEWRDPKSGATLSMHYLERDEDAEVYQGWDLPFQIFEEIGNFETSRPMDLLFGSLRSSAEIPKVRIATGNPGGRGHQWVKKRYIDGHKPYEIFTYQPQPDLAPEIFLTSCFIPATLDDNPIAIKNNPNIEATLAAATMGNAALYKAWRRGDWDAVVGAYFDVFSESRHVYTDQSEVLSYYPRWIAIDWGFKHDAAVYWFASDGEGRIWITREIVVNRLDSPALGKMIADATPEVERPFTDAVYLSPNVFDKDSSMKTIASQISAELVKFGLPQCSRADDARISGWMLMYQLFSQDRLRIHNRCRRAIDCIPVLQRDPKHPEDVQKAEGDDPGEAIRYGIKTRDALLVVPEKIRITKRLVEFAKANPSADLTSKALEAGRILSEEKRAAAPVFYARRSRHARAR